ncbi:MAG: hypothetical protein AB8E82_07925 [Aureispira sp.]
MNNYTEKILETHGSYIFDFKNLDQVIKDLNVLIGNQLNVDSIGVFTGLLSDNNITVFENVVSCMVLIEWYEHSNNQLPIGDLNKTEYYLQKKIHNQLSFFDTLDKEDLFREKVLFRAYHRMRMSFGKKRKQLSDNEKPLRENFQAAIKDLLKTNPNHAIGFISSYIHSLFGFLAEESSYLEDKGKLLQLVNNLFRLEAQLILFQIGNREATQLPVNRNLITSENDLLWINHKNQIASQEAEEIDQMIDLEINRLRKEKKRKERDEFTKFIFNKYDNLYKALS